jgi:ABC-type branched-subunit amino acid transport system substrate-binding protein
MKTTRFFVTGLATVALAATCTPSGAEPEFKVGFVLSQIGSLAELSKVFLDGAEIGIAMVNDAGGIGGLKARLVVCDSQGQEPQAVSAPRS